MSTGDQSYRGGQELSSATSEGNMLDFLIRSIVGRNVTATLVMVKSVTNSGGVDAVGLIDVQPMVAQLDGKGKPTPHGVIHNVPYMRVQGGAYAIILDPQVGDIGIAVFAHRDISAVKNSKKPANPGSRRRFDWADALYVGGVLNGVPTQYIRFSGDGIEMVAPLTSVPGNFNVGTGADGSFGTPSGQTVTVRGGIVTNISP